MCKPKNMRVMRAALCFLCCLCLTLPSSISCAQEAQASSDTDEMALTYGLSAGLFDESLMNDRNRIITGDELYRMLESLVTACDASKLSMWHSKTLLAGCDTPLRRDQGMLAVYLAAQTLGLNYINYHWMSTHEQCGEAVWDELAPDYPLFPGWSSPSGFIARNEQDEQTWDSAIVAAYFFGMGHSAVDWAGPALFEMKGESMAVGDSLTVEDAMHATMRLYQNVHAIDPVQRVPSKWDEAFLARAEARRQSILGSSTAIVKSDVLIPGSTYTGKAYYVSNQGSDRNKGTSSKKPWATVARVRQAKLKAGDIVFFERGGVWREELQCESNVTYSAYGEGAKPRFYGSQQNGTGGESWELWRTGDHGKKVWRFKTKISDCGGVVFNDGEAYASRVYQYWNGSSSVYPYTNKPFDIMESLVYDLQFCCDYSYEAYDQAQSVVDMDTTGDLYLRCDKGNPGELYPSIEFQTMPVKIAGYCGIIKMQEFMDGSVLDNLCVMYSCCVGISSHMCHGMLIQNCEIAWVGGTPLVYKDGCVAVAGEGIKMEGSHNTVRNCYVHDCFDGGIISESDWTMPIPYMQGQTIEGNLIERCMSGVLNTYKDRDGNAEPRFGELTITDNYILYTGYGWSGDPHYDYTWRTDSYAASLNFWEYDTLNKGIQVTDNVLYLSTSSLVHMGLHGSNAPRFSANTYVQNEFGMLAFTPASNGIRAYRWTKNGAEALINELLGDSMAVAR